jgi:SAM-dependent methyltransferase
VTEHVLGWPEFDRQREYFDATRNQYDPRLITNPPKHVATEISLVIEYLDGLSKDDWIVDFGAGTGRLTYPLLAAGYHVVAVDVSQVSLAKIAEVTRDLPGRVLRTHDSLPPRERFVALTGADILHHVDLATQIPRFAEALDDGGRLAFSEPNGLNPFWYVFIALSLDWKVERHIFHCHGPGISRHLKDSGFKDVRIHGLGVLPTALFNWSRLLDRANRWLGQLPLLRLFAYRIIVTAVR